MAKQLVNPIERHIEKGVVAMSAAMLLASVALFLISSPNKLELGDTVVTPASIDNVVAQHAEKIRATLRNHRSTSVVPLPLAEAFAAAIKQPPPSVFVAVVPIRPSVPQIDPPITKVADFALVTVVQPEKPKVTSGRSTVRLQKYTPLNWATVSAVFDRNTQSELQKRAYGAANGNIHTAAPEIQRRAQRRDGTWSDDDWVSVSPDPAGRPLPSPTLEVVDGPSGPMVTFEQKKRIDRVLVELASTEEQRERLRPLFHEIVNGDAWSFPMLVSYSLVMQMDDETVYPEKEPSQNPVDYYGLLDRGIKPANDTKELTPAQQAAAEMQQGKDLLARAKKDRSKYDARAAFNIFFTVKQNRAANASMRNEANKLQLEADELTTQYDREELTGRGRPAPGGQRGGDTEDASGRQMLPTQQLWVHDAAEGSIEGGKTYQYRMRFRIYNLFAGEAGKFTDPNDATKILVASEWSPPSDPVSVEPWEVFFVTGDDQGKNQAGFEFFRWFYGAWVKSRRHKFGVGDLVTVTQRTTVPSVTSPGASDSVQVDYNAEAIVLDVDFSRSHRERRKGSGPGGFRFAATRDETAVVLVDRLGRLTERLIPRDKNHPAKKKLGEKLYRGSR